MKEQLKLLEQELIMLQENIVRIKKYQKENKNNGYLYKSNVVGEFKHRIAAIKKRMTIVSSITTRDLFE